MMNTRKLTAFALALTLTACTGCGVQREYTDNTDETEASGDIIIDEDGMISGDVLYNSYRTTELPSINMEKMEVTAIGNILFRTSYDYMTKSTSLFWYNAETGESGEFIPACFQEKDANEQTSISVLSLPDGRTAALCNTYTEQDKGMELHRRCMEVYDDGLNLVETIEFPEHVNAGEILGIYGFCVDASGNWYSKEWDADSQTVTIECYDKDFQHYGSIAYPTNMQILGFFQGRQGEVYAYFTTPDYKMVESYYKVYRLDAETRTCTEIQKSFSLRGWHGPYFCAGTGEYDFYYSDDYGIYGVQGDTSTCVMSYINSDIPVGSVTYYAPFANGKFFLQTFNDSNFTDGCFLAEKRTPEDVANTQIVTLSTVGMFERLEDIVIAYNRQETGTRIIVQDYANYNTAEDQSLGHAQLREDLLDGIVADMVCTDGLNFESLASKGLFADWYDLMDADAEFSRSDYLENYFESFEYDERLQRLGISFHVLTAAAKTEHAGEQQGRMLAEFMEIPFAGGMERFQFVNQDYALSHWFTQSQNSFIDRKNAACYFDTPEFVQLLEMIKGYPTGEFEEVVWEQTEYGEQQVFRSAEDNTAYLEDRALTDFCQFSQPIDYHALIRTAFRDTPITLMGYPTAEEDTNGGIFQSDFTISVNAQSEQKEAVWDFMKYLLSEEYQKKLNDSMPIHKGILEEKLTLATKQVSAKAMYDGIEVNIGAATQESMDTLYAYIQSIGTAFYYDATVEQILQEETEMFLAGNQTAEKTAAMMQSRVSIYLSEQS